MLCDEIIEGLSSDNAETGKAYRLRDREGCDTFVAKLRAAQKFVLTNDTFLMARNVIRQKPASLLAAIDYANSPYPLTWIEYETAFVKKKSTLDQMRDVPKAKRVGFMVEDLSGKLGITMGYSYRDPDFCATINPLIWIFDKAVPDGLWEEMAAMMAMYGDDDLQAAMDDPIRDGLSQNSMKFSQSDMKCVNLIDRMFVPLPNPCLLP